MKKKELSPMMTHYLNLKQEYPDCVIFYRLGDFYEMFFEDAVRVSKILDLTLTGRDCGLEERAPMCGIPFHAADTYIAKLVEKGEKVAICEQVSDVKDKVSAKNLVERKVIKIITAGTITENSLLDDKTNNYLASVYPSQNGIGVAWTDITTGDFFTKFIYKKDDFDKLADLLVRINPSEIICPEGYYKTFNDLSIVKHNVLPKFFAYKEFAYLYSHAERKLKEHFNVLSLQCFGIEENKTLVTVCGSLLEYLQETQKHALINISKITLEEDNEYMSLDGVALKNLEIVKTLRDSKRYGSLLWHIDNCSTPMGSRTLYSYLTQPLQDINKINYRLDGVEELYKNTLMRNAVKQLLDEVRDTERLAGKISNNILLPVDALSLAKSLSIIPSIKFSLSGATSKIINDIIANFYDFSNITSIIESAIYQGEQDTKKGASKIIADGFDKELDRLRSIKTNSQNIIKEMEEKEREETGIKTLRIAYNKVFGYFIEVTNSFKDKVPYRYVRKQTLVGAERFITEELKVLEEEILTCSEKIDKLESEIFNKIKNLLKEHIKQILITSKCFATLDAILSLAIVAKKFGYTRPIIKNFGETLKITDGRHPVVEALISEKFVPNDTILNNDEDRMLIITGPNMAGKSTYMRQIAIITLLSHIGSFVPCKYAEIPLVDKIFTRVGASDSLISEQSTFMVEMSEVANILNKATKNSLLILDEVGRGTSTYDGLSIAWSVVEYIASKIKAKTLFATHYHELSELEGKIEGVKNYKITVKEFNGSIIFLRKIMEGSANKSFGIEVASLAGVPAEITKNAKKILKKLENNDIVLPVKDNIEQSNDIFCESEIIKSLIEVDIDDMSPRDALEFLYTLKKQIK